MTRTLSKLLTAAAGTVALAGSLWAFTPGGPTEDWQSDELGYDLFAGAPGIFPKLLDNEYRFHSPTFTYAMDASFLTFFGAEGVRAVDEAFAILNRIPPASTITNLNQFPLANARVNHLAASLNLLDLRSYVLSTVLNQLGLAAPEFYVWVTQGHANINDTDFFTISHRNYDPVTLRPSSYVNGQLYTYRILEYADNQWNPFETALIPGRPQFSTAAFGALDSGFYFTGLTRDDVGGWRYLLSPLNYNMDVLPTNVVAGTLRGGSGNVVGAPGISGGETWGLPGSILVVNGTATTASGTAGLPGSTFTGTLGNGSPWDLPGTFLLNTATTTGTTDPTTGGTTGTPAFDFVRFALRPGVDKITFVKTYFDSLLGGFQTNANFSYIDRFLSGDRVLTSRAVTRVLAAPDLVIRAADLGYGPAGAPWIAAISTAWENTTELFYQQAPGVVGPGTGPSTDGVRNAIDGPGLISAPLSITISKIGPALYHIGTGGEADGAILPFWGSYDGSTNAPVVYPEGTSIREIENLVLRRR